MKKVYFIGSGYEIVKFIFVNATTNSEALEKAEQWYKETKQSFYYIEMEIGI